MTISTADRLVQLRKEKGLSQEALAAKLGVSRQAISKWERAEASPDTDNLIALADIYGITLDALLDSEKEIPSAEPKTEPEAEKKEEKPIRYSLYPETASKMFRFPYPLVVIIAYLALSFGLKGVMGRSPWLVFSLLFLTIPMYYMLASACRMTSKRTFFISYARADFNYNGISFLWLRFQYVGKNAHAFPCNSALLLVRSGLRKGK